MNKLTLNETETRVYTLILNKGPLPATGLEIKKRKISEFIPEL